MRPCTEATLEHLVSCECCFVTFLKGIMKKTNGDRWAVDSGISKQTQLHLRVGIHSWCDAASTHKPRLAAKHEL